MKERKHYTAEQKIIILRELLENNIPISQLAEKYSVRPNDIYNWKKKLFEGAKEIFTVKNPSSNIRKYKVNCGCRGFIIIFIINKWKKLNVNNKFNILF